MNDWACVCVCASVGAKRILLTNCQWWSPLVCPKQTITGWWYTYPWKIWRSVEIIIPNLSPLVFKSSLAMKFPKSPSKSTIEIVFCCFKNPMTWRSSFPKSHENPGFSWLDHHFPMVIGGINHWNPYFSYFFHVLALTGAVPSLSV